MTALVDDSSFSGTTSSFALGVTGFNREAALVAGPGLTTIAGGGDAAALAERLEAAVEGAIGIVSFGLTGALADGLAIGDWIVADRLAGATELETDPRWRDAALARLPGARAGGFFADGRMIDTVAEKRALGERHQALGVDMESHVAGAVAKRHGLPFAIIRIVSDGVDHLLPPAIVCSMRPDGGINGGAMLRSLAGNPAQLPDLIATMRNAAAAFRGLGRGGRLLGPALGCPYLGQLALDVG